ncbi:hypothetical protein BV22DRAFT_903018 [Leucogyrophana mollusca]|uniref:Uncharacterized protein n=1 Tax=Leucogyrophana mollusca TaxID=85980 RepID=A0ACB8AZA7_9AGAM|nr:hypothetical protein BV22DRAFT_903018 [Leucogyrophana mollusca]
MTIMCVRLISRCDRRIVRPSSMLTWDLSHWNSFPISLSESEQRRGQVDLCSGSDFDAVVLPCKASTTPPTRVGFVIPVQSCGVIAIIMAYMARFSLSHFHPCTGGDLERLSIEVWR